VDFFHAYVVVVVGVAISFILPIIRKSIPKGEDGGAQFTDRLRSVAYPYIAILAASLLTAILVIAIIGDHIMDDWRVALISGFAWDSTLQKVTL
jgi:hypothetical protein